VLVISLLWPLADLAGYSRRRVPGLAFLQLFLFALPFNFDTAVFNALAPRPGRGPLGWVLNVFQLSMSVRIALLLFTSLGWRLPWRPQVGVQALKVAMLVAFGTRAYCDSVVGGGGGVEASACRVR
jgi:hypothetical protein